jgi:hypothetical protein
MYKQAVTTGGGWRRSTICGDIWLVEIIQLDGPMQQHLYPPFYLTTPKEWIKIHNTWQQDDNYKKSKNKTHMRGKKKEIPGKRLRQWLKDLSSPAPPGDYRRTCTSLLPSKTRRRRLNGGVLWYLCLVRRICSRLWACWRSCWLKGWLHEAGYVQSSPLQLPLQQITTVLLSKHLERKLHLFQLWKIAKLKLSQDSRKLCFHKIDVTLHWQMCFSSIINLKIHK